MECHGRDASMKMLVLGKVKRGGGRILARRRLFSNDGKETLSVALSHDFIVGDVVVVPLKLGAKSWEIVRD